MITKERYVCIRNAFNECYNKFFSKWAKIAMEREFTDEEWSGILEESRQIGEKYKEQECRELVRLLLIELNRLLEK